MSTIGKKSTLRWVEFAFALAVLVALVLLMLPIFRNSYSPIRPLSCVDNLRQWSTVFSMYRHENNQFLPPPQGFQPFGPAENAPGCTNIHDEFAFCPDLSLIFPNYSSNKLLLACPDGPNLLPQNALGPVILQPWRLDPQRFGVLESISMASCQYAGAISNGDAAYTYFGWRIDQSDDGGYVINREDALHWQAPATGPVQIVALLVHIQVTNERTYKDVQASREVSFSVNEFLPQLGPPYSTSGNQDTATNQPSSSIYQFFYGLRFGELAEDEKNPPPRSYYATTPVMWDTIYRDSTGSPRFTHRNPDGANVLYMDGHVDFVTYPGKFPLSRSFVNSAWVR